MERNQMEMLWESRFHKILEMEKSALDFYKSLSRKDDLVEASPRLREILEELIEDEERHNFICKELLRVVRKASQKG